jgi:hypothetical protein
MFDLDPKDRFRIVRVALLVSVVLTAGLLISSVDRNAPEGIAASITLLFVTIGALILSEE